ncbi:BREX-1 system adenine-specific DNA-methyltransferase PglX [Lacticaseibacillus sp. N501-2]|uniref:BREX-1 system adenine-specific DNA-methyltransferase PglX n=1 Tax=Lacticaseibacillus salsurae TaxID=3367729 RepID=UPI0038B2A748
METIPEADFDIASDDSQGQVEIIGWLYQYYNQEPKDAAFKKRNYSQADIPAVTQLFTPDWIVKYLVENSLGRLWINHLQVVGDTRSALELAQAFQWQYFMPEAKQPDNIKLHVQANNANLTELKPEKLTMIDPSMGSGHILIYAFDVLIQIYTTEGYSQREAAKSILAHNLFGADIDKRAFQLAYFAMMMKGRQYDRRILRSDVAPHVFDIPSVHWSHSDLELLSDDPGTIQSLETVSSLFGSGDELGSLINVDPNTTDLESLHEIVSANDSAGQLSLQSAHVSQLCHDLDAVLNVLDLLTTQYQIGITNPPYMGSGKMPSKLSTFVKKHYPNSKSDLFAVFMERLRDLTIDHGYYAMITQHQWMFLSSFEALRKQLSQQTFINLTHLGTRAFEEIGGEVVQSVAFVMQNSPVSGYISTYERLVDLDSQSKKEQAYLKAVNDPDLSYVYRANQANFEKIPGSPIAYWILKSSIQVFQKPLLGELVAPRTGLQTGDNAQFLRKWFEVDSTKTNILSSDKTQNTSCKWLKINTGGDSIRWYGQYNTVINWEHGGRNVKNQKSSVIRNESYYFHAGISWKRIGSSSMNFKLLPTNFIFDQSGDSLFTTEIPIGELISYLNSKVAAYFLKAFAPTLNLTAGNISNLPFLPANDPRITKISSANIKLSEFEWNLGEQSWNFVSDRLIMLIVEHTLALLRKLADIQAHVPKMCQRIIIPFKGVNQLSW